MRCIALILMTLLLWFGLAFGQVTSEVPTPIETVGKGNLVGVTEPFVVWGPLEKGGGVPIASVSWTASEITDIDAVWKVEFDHKTSVDSLYEVKITCENLRGRVIYSYRDSMHAVHEFVVPDRTRSGVKGFRADSLFYMVPDGGQLSTSEHFYLTVRQEKSVEATAEGLLKAMTMDEAGAFAETGEMFTVSDTFAMASDDTVNLLIEVPSTVNAGHIWGYITASDSAYLTMWQAPTCSDSGRATAELSMNMVSDDTPGITIGKYATYITESGTIRYSQYVPGNTSHIFPAQGKWICKTSTLYLVVITSTSGATASVNNGSVTLFWREE